MICTSKLLKRLEYVSDAEKETIAKKDEGQAKEQERLEITPGQPEKNFIH